MYENIDPASVHLLFQGLVGTIVDPARLQHLTGMLGSPPVPAMQAQYVSLLMAGNAELDVAENVPIGEAAPAPLNSPFVAFTLRLFSLWPVVQMPTGLEAKHPEEIGPELPLRNLSTYGANTPAEREAWHGHPLIDQLASQVVEFDAHVRFVIWDKTPAMRKHAPHAAGTVVTLLKKDGSGTLEPHATPSTLMVRPTFTYPIWSRWQDLGPTSGSCSKRTDSRRRSYAPDGLVHQGLAGRHAARPVTIPISPARGSGSRATCHLSCRGRVHLLTSARFRRRAHQR